MTTTKLVSSASQGDPKHPRFDTTAIRKIRQTFGAPSAVCGVLHKGHVLFTHADGLANVETGLEASPDTVYNIASCSKAFVTAAISILDHSGHLSWHKPVSDYLPEFRTLHDPLIGQRATLVDLCSHGTGLAPLDSIGQCFKARYVNDGSDQVGIVSNLPVAYDLRSKFLYNNFMYGLAGDVLTKVTGKSAGQAIKDLVFAPLGLNRTGTSAAEYPDDNVAVGYHVLDDESLEPLYEPQLVDKGLAGASGFVRSSVNDMLAWAKALMDAERDEKQQDRKSSGPLRNIAYTRNAHRPVASEVSGPEYSYGLGWFRHMLPSPMLSSFANDSFAGRPVLGAASAPRLAIAHWGEHGGWLTSFYTFPDTCSAVIVVANCSQLRGDPTDLIAQSLIQDLFGLQPRIDYSEYAIAVVAASARKWDELVQEYHAKRVLNTRLPSPSDLTGSYVHNGFMWSIEITQARSGNDNELLEFRINGLDEQHGRLQHYHYDVWTFMPASRDDAIRKGMHGFLVLPMLLMAFKRDAYGQVCSLEWDLQAGACEGPAPGLAEAVGPIRFERASELLNTASKETRSEANR